MAKEQLQALGIQPVQAEEHLRTVLSGHRGRQKTVWLFVLIRKVPFAELQKQGWLRLHTQHFLALCDRALWDTPEKRSYLSLDFCEKDTPRQAALRIPCLFLPSQKNTSTEFLAGWSWEGVPSSWKSAAELTTGIYMAQEFEQRQGPLELTHICSSQDCRFMYS